MTDRPEPEELTPEEPGTLMDPDDEFTPDVHPAPTRARTHNDLEIPPGARTMRNLRDRRRVIE